MFTCLSTTVEGCRTTETIRQMKIWRLWSKALGEKASKCDKESDKIAMIRTFIFVTYLITNTFIIAGVVRHWNKTHTNEIQSDLSQTKEERFLKTDCRSTFN